MSISAQYIETGQAYESEPSSTTPSLPEQLRELKLRSYYELVLTETRLTNGKEMLTGSWKYLAFSSWTNKRREVDTPAHISTGKLCSSNMY